MNEPYKVIFYKKVLGRCPMDEFLDEINVKARAKVMRWIGKLEAVGPDLPRPYADPVRGKIRELRLVFASDQYRCLYFFDGRKIILTHGFIKKTEKVPENEIERAENMMREYFHENI